MPSDPSIDAGFQTPAPYNPLVSMGQVMGIKNAMAQNQLMGAETANAQMNNQTGQQALATSTPPTLRGRVAQI